MARDRGGHRSRRGRRGRLGISGGILKWYVDICEQRDVVIGVEPDPAKRAEAAQDTVDPQDQSKLGDAGFTGIWSRQRRIGDTL